LPITTWSCRPPRPSRPLRGRSCMPTPSTASSRRPTTAGSAWPTWSRW